LVGAQFVDLARRGKYIAFTLRPPGGEGTLHLLGHLGMTGRMYLQPINAPLPKHTAVALNLGTENFVFEDTRYFGRFTLDTSAQARLGPEALGDEFTVEYFFHALRRSAQAIKIKLLDQSLVAGVGNIYACESLFRAGVSPRVPARKLSRTQTERLRGALRDTLAEAIQFGSVVALDWPGKGERDGFFYYGRVEGAPECEERLCAYDRQGQPCPMCRTPIRRIVQAARSTFYCPRCQRT